MEEEGSRLVREGGPKTAGKPSPGNIGSYSYRLYFKGLIIKDTTGLLAGFGVAIYKGDNLLSQTKGLLDDSATTDSEAELMALKRGLTEAVSLGITHISIYYEDVDMSEFSKRRRSRAPKYDKTALLVDDVQRIRQELTSSILLPLTRFDSTTLANKLAREAIDSEISKPKMFCGHQSCVECVKRQIQVRLLERSVTIGPHYRCRWKLLFGLCPHILTHKLRGAMWGSKRPQEVVT